jgi:hypothetical protein
MTVHKRKKNSKWLEWLTVLTFVSALAWYFYLRPPWLKRGEITSVTIAIGKVHATVTSRPECEKIYKALRQARPRTDHKCPTIGYITLQFKDGGQDAVGVLPGHDLELYDLRHRGTCFTLSREVFFAALNNAGVDTSMMPELDGKRDEDLPLPSSR